MRCPRCGGYLHETYAGEWTCVNCGHVVYDPRVRPEYVSLPNWSPSFGTHVLVLPINRYALTERGIRSA